MSDIINFTIPFFESLFTKQPDLKTLEPVTFKKQIPSRKVIRKGDRDHHVGRFQSRKNQATIEFESALEKHACTNFETYPEIKSYCSQPYPLTLFYSDKKRTVYPDFELTTFDNKKILIDIRHESGTKKPLFIERCNSLSFYAEQRGMKFTLLTEKILRNERLLNAQWLLSLAIGKAKQGLTSATLIWISNQNNPTFSDLFEITVNYPQVRCVIASLALDGHLGINFDQPLRNQVINLKSKLER